MATPIGNAVGLTGDALKDPLLQGGIWTFAGSHVLSYSFNFNFDLVDGQVVQGPGGAWTAGFFNAFTHALDAWSAVANLGFVHLTAEDGKYVFQSGADIAAALTGDDLQALGAVALGFFPDPAYANTVLQSAGYDRTLYPNPEGDVLFDNFNAGYANLDDGSFGLWTMLHELGHAIGLKHPFDDGGNGRPTYAGEGLPQYDNERYTVMSYSGNGNTGATGHAATPMPLDILAIQQLYGANMSYRAGTDTYQLQIDHAMRTLWDAGGTDTLDAHALTGAVALDLRPGALMQLSADTVLGIAYNVTIENAIGGAGNDTLTGNAADNTLTGGAGTNTYYGGTGNDTYYVSSATDDVRENLGEGTDRVYASVSYSISGSAAIEELTLTGSSSIDGTAGTGTVLMTGNAGNNRLDSGWAGTPEIRGGAGDDTYVIQNPGTTITENPGEGTDTVSLLSTVDYTLPANVENFVLDSAFPSASTLVFTGNALPNTMTAGAGGNRIDGGIGADTLVGGGGADTYVVDDPGDTVIESFDAAIDTVESAITWTLGQNLENLALAGAATIDGTGNALSNAIAGNDAANLLRGAAGTDLLTGGGGGDTLDGGTGFDWMQGGTGDDTYVVDTTMPAYALALAGETSGPYRENVTDGRRYYHAAPTATFSTLNPLDLTHDGLVDWLGIGITDTDSGDWWYVYFNTYQLGQNLAPGTYANAERSAYPLTGKAGFDVGGDGRGFSGTASASFVIDQVAFDYSGATPVLTRFAASFAVQAIVGLHGWVAYNATTGYGEEVRESPGQGTDTVQSAASYTLPDNVENLALTGTAAINGTGNGLANAITANGANNVLAGGAGNDILDGGSGTDTATYGGSRASYTVARDVALGGYAVNALAGGEGADLVTNVEVLQFADSMTVLASLATDAGIVDGFRPYGYLAANPDLLAFYGSDTAAATGHFATWGFGEGRGFTGFSSFRYLASNPDLLAFYGANADAATEHYARWGFSEGRGSAGFNAYGYLASNPDLLAFYGANPDAAAEHYVRWGSAEGRGTGGFDAWGYLDSNPDLLGFYGPDARAAAEHYARWGQAEGRGTTAFSPYRYLASNPDLLSYYGSNTAGAAEHFARWGHAEGRGTSAFDALAYLASNTDLIASLGTDPNAAAQQYVLAGQAAGRSTGAFDAQAYLAANPDLAAFYGADTAGATAHFVLWGRTEGRPAAFTGNAGDNILTGQAGNDTLAGGLGNDSLTGGGGADRFVFDTAPNASNNLDSVTDFTPGTDKILLDDAILAALGSGGERPLDAANFTANAGGSAGDADDHITYDSVTGTLAYDADGNGAGAAIPFATLTGNPAITVADLGVI